MQSHNREAGAEVLGASTDGAADVFLLALEHGPKPATAEAWHRYASAVRKTLLRALGPHADVDDATQEVFLRLLRRIAKLRDATELRTFIIAATARVMEWESRRLIQLSIRLQTPSRLPLPVAPQLDLERREALDHIYAILDRFKPVDRTIFILRQSGQLQLPEIADVVDLSLATVKRRLGRIWTRVRLLIERDPVLATYLSQDGAPLSAF